MTARYIGFFRTLRSPRWSLSQRVSERVLRRYGLQPRRLRASCECEDGRSGRRVSRGCRTWRPKAAACRGERSRVVHVVPTVGAGDAARGRIERRVAQRASRRGPAGRRRRRAGPWRHALGPRVCPAGTHSRWRCAPRWHAEPHVGDRRVSEEITSARAAAGSPQAAKKSRSRPRRAASACTLRAGCTAPAAACAARAPPLLSI